MAVSCRLQWQGSPRASEVEPGQVTRDQFSLAPGVLPGSTLPAPQGAPAARCLVGVVTRVAPPQSGMVLSTSFGFVSNSSWSIFWSIFKCATSWACDLVTKRACSGAGAASCLWPGSGAKSEKGGGGLQSSFAAVTLNCPVKHLLGPAWLPGAYSVSICSPALPQSTSGQFKQWVAEGWDPPGTSPEGLKLQRQTCPPVAAPGVGRARLWQGGPSTPAPHLPPHPHFSGARVLRALEEGRQQHVLPWECCPSSRAISVWGV